MFACNSNSKKTYAGELVADKTSPSMSGPAFFSALSQPCSVRSRAVRPIRPRVMLTSFIARRASVIAVPDVIVSQKCRPKSELHFRCNGSVLPDVPHDRPSTQSPRTNKSRRVCWLIVCGHLHVDSFFQIWRDSLKRFKA